MVHPSALTDAEVLPGRVYYGALAPTRLAGACFAWKGCLPRKYIYPGQTVVPRVRVTPEENDEPLT